MKKGILFLFLLAGASGLKAQSLKELLYSGKLKMDSNSVIRRTDDLQSKIDTSQKKAAEPERPKVVAVPADSARSAAVPGADSTSGAVVVTDSAAAAPPPSKDLAVPARNNTRIWKDYTDSLANDLKAEVLSSKKIKKETYYILVEYELDTTGQVNVTNVSASPQNDFLQEQVKQRLILSPPHLNPFTDGNNKARKVKRRHNFTITKE